MYLQPDINNRNLKGQHFHISLKCQLILSVVNDDNDQDRYNNALQNPPYLF